MSVLEVQHLSKSYGGVQAVRDVSFSVASGELLAADIVVSDAEISTTYKNLLAKAPRRRSPRMSFRNAVNDPYSSRSPLKYSRA